MSAKIAAVVLASGASTRLGRPKQEVVVGGETLLRRALRLAAEAGLEPVIAVVRPAQDADALRAAGCLVVVNRQADEGVATSIVHGIRAAETAEAGGAVLMTCDQVGLTAKHLRALGEHPGSVTASAYAGQTGVPAYFPAAAFPQLLALSGDTGARKLLANARCVTLEALALDVDTEADVRRAREFVESGV